MSWQQHKVTVEVQPIDGHPWGKLICSACGHIAWVPVVLKDGLLNEETIEAIKLRVLEHQHRHRDPMLDFPEPKVAEKEPVRYIRIRRKRDESETSKEEA